MNETQGKMKKVMDTLGIKPEVQVRFLDATTKYSAAEQEQILGILIYQLKTFRDIRKADLQALQKFVLTEREFAEDQKNAQDLGSLEEALKES